MTLRLGTSTGRRDARGVKSWLCILALVLGAAGCKKKQDAQPTPTPPPVADAAAVSADATLPDASTVDAAAAAAPTPPAGAIAISEDGVGPLNATSKLDVKSLKAAFPGFDVKKASIPMGEGDLADEHVAVSKGGKLAMKIYGDISANSIEVVSDDIWNPWGLKIGMTYADVAKVMGPLDCSDAAEHTDWKQYVAECDTEKTKNWSFDFTHEGTEAKELIAKPDDLAKAKLVAFRWEAPGSGPPGTE